MRKDVKLGFAIGGVLLAVLIVYVLVVPGGKDQRLTSAAGDAAAQKASGQGGAGVKLEPVSPQPAAPTTQQAPGANVADAGSPPPAAPVTYTPTAGAGTDPFEQQVSDPPVSANAKSKDVDWSKLLNATGNDVLMVTPASARKTEVAAVLPVSTDKRSSGDAAVADITKPGPTPVVPPPALEEKPTPDAAPVAGAPVPPPVTPPTEATPTPVTPAPISEAPPAPTTAAPAPVAAGQQQTHTVETGETFSTIALRYYGDANLYSPLMRANPSIEPTRLRPGMKVVIPPAGEVRPTIAKAPVLGAPVSTDHAQVSSTKIETPIDATKQYRVQTGDSLYSIGKKLYGRGDRADAIYQVNKAMIGDDMHRLKVGQVLSLPDPPTKK